MVVGEDNQRLSLMAMMMMVATISKERQRQTDRQTETERQTEISREGKQRV